MTHSLNCAVTQSTKSVPRRQNDIKPNPVLKCDFSTFVFFLEQVQRRINKNCTFEKIFQVQRFLRCDTWPCLWTPLPYNIVCFYFSLALSALYVYFNCVKYIGFLNGDWWGVHGHSGHRFSISRTKAVTQNPLLNVPYFTGDRDKIYYYGMYIAKATANQPLAGCGFGSEMFEEV